MTVWICNTLWRETECKTGAEVNVQYQLWSCDWFSVALEKSDTASIADIAQKNMINGGNGIILTSQAPLYCYSPNQISSCLGPYPRGTRESGSRWLPTLCSRSGPESDFLCLDGSDKFVVIYTVALDLGPRETEVCCRYGKLYFFSQNIVFSWPYISDSFWFHKWILLWNSVVILVSKWTLAVLTPNLE